MRRDLLCKSSLSPNYLEGLNMNMNKNINVAKYLDKYCEVVMNDCEQFSGRLLENYNGELYFITGGPTIIKVVLLENVKSIKIGIPTKTFIY